MLEGKLSTEMQIAEIEKFCKYNDYEIVHIYSDEDLSGSETKHRTQFNKMFEDIENRTYGKIDIVVCYNISRFSRSVQDLNVYTHKLKEELDCDFRSSQESFIDTSKNMGKFCLNIFGSIAELERDRLISVIQDSNINRARLGKRWTNGGIPPYGYVKSGKTIVPDPGTSEIVKRIYHMFLDEEIPLSTIAKKLNREEVDPNRPDQDVSIYRKTPLIDELQQPVSWNASKIRRILENPCYTGINVTNRRKKTKSANGNKTSHTNNNPRNWIWSDNLRIVREDEDNYWDSDFEILDYDIEPLITWETFIETQKLKEKNAKCEAVREKTNYLLKDLLYCGRCGRKMNGSVNHRDPKRTYYYYRCNKRIYLDACDMPSVHCDVVDNYVMCALSDSFILLMVHDIVDKENNKANAIIDKYKGQIKDLETDINKCNTAILNLVEMIKTSATIDIVKDTLSEEINKEQNKKIRLEKELKRLKLKSENEERTRADLDGFVQAWRDADFAKMSFDLRREFFLKYIDRVVYYSPEHIDIYVKVNKITKKLEFSDEQKAKIEWKLNKQKTEKKKIYNTSNKFLKMLKTLENTAFSWMWHFVDEPLRVHIHTTTREKDYIVVKISFYE